MLEVFPLHYLWRCLSAVFIFRHSRIFQCLVLLIFVTHTWFISVSHSFTPSVFPSAFTLTKLSLFLYFILPEPQKKSGEKATPAKKKGGEIDIDGENDGWMEIDIDGEDGWMEMGCG